MKPLVIVFGILVLITLTYTSTHSVMGVGNTMFKEGNGKRRVRRGRQGFEGTALNTAYRSGFREGEGGGCDEPGSCGFEGGRSGFREGNPNDDPGVDGFEGFSSAKNAAPLRQGFAGRRKQGFKGKMRRRREGLPPNEEKPVAEVANAAVDPNTPVDEQQRVSAAAVAAAGDGDDGRVQSFVGNRGRRRRR